MSPRQALRHAWDSLVGSDFDRALRRARRSGRHRFLFGWNRGLGDVGLGLVSHFERIRREFADARIDVVTRSDLEPVFALAGVDAIHVAAGLARGARFEILDEARRLGLDPASYAGIFGNPDLRRWARTTREVIAPRLHWPERFDRLAQRFAQFDAAGPWVGVHVHSETAQFYRYTKDWPAGRWPQLFASVRARVPARFVLFGAARDERIEGDGVVDLRGQTSLLELLALVRAHARAVVAPDSGILSIVYLLDMQKELDVVSLWADPRQGILKLGQPSPNTLLRHHPLLGRDEDVGNISVQEVADTLVSCLERPAAAGRRTSAAQSRGIPE
jgi:hypothetical protein